MVEQDESGLTRRCPRLGGPVTFQYCRESARDTLPCWKILECWWEIFDVAAYLKERLSDADFDRLVSAKPKPKIVSLLELIEKAKENVESKPSEDM